MVILSWSRHAVMERSGSAKRTAQNSIGRLPLEILSEIFWLHVAQRMTEYHARGKYTGSPYSWMVITQVCRYWREEVLRLSRIWTWFYQPLPQSHRLDVVSFDICRARLSWRTSVTHIILHQFKDLLVEDILPLLREASRVESLELFGLSRKEQPEGFQLPVVRLDRLSNIRLKGSADGCALILDHLSFPISAALTLTINCQTFVAESDVLGVVQRVVRICKEDADPIEGGPTTRVVSATLEFGEKIKFVGYCDALWDSFHSEESKKVFEFEVAKPKDKHWGANFHSTLFGHLRVFYVEELKIYDLSPRIDFFLAESGAVVLAKHVLDACRAIQGVKELIVTGWHEQLICQLLRPQVPCDQPHHFLFSEADNLALERPVSTRGRVCHSVKSQCDVIEEMYQSKRLSEARDQVRDSEDGIQGVERLDRAELYEVLKMRKDGNVGVTWLSLEVPFGVNDDQHLWLPVLGPEGGVQFIHK